MTMKRASAMAAAIAALWGIGGMFSAAWADPEPATASTVADLASTEEAPEKTSEQIIDALLAEGLKEIGAPSLSAAIVRGQEVVFARGFGLADIEKKRPATEKTLYRIGSINKVFTTTLLIEMRDAGDIALDDPISDYLPEDAQAPEPLPGGAEEITLRHLATHTSGLPRMPVNLSGREGDPYNDYPVEALWSGLAETRLERPIGQRFSYSNFGAGLLGQLLTVAADEDSYETLLANRILEPLGMETATFEPDPDDERVAVEYGGLLGLKPVPSWRMGALNPAGGLAASAEDMAQFVALHLRAGAADSEVISGGSLFEAHAVQRLASADWDTGVGLGWIIQPDAEIGEDIVWHNGGMAGSRSWLGLAPGAQVGVVLLTNSDREADELGLKLLRAAVAEFAIESEAVIPAEAEKVAEHLAAILGASEPERDIADLFHPMFLQAIPAEGLASMFASMRATFGDCQDVELEAGDEPDQFRARFIMSKGYALGCAFQYDAAEEPKLVYFQFLGQEKVEEESGEN
jgi:D-alanyl-D-alanine-carboxypeptidase/D-alanyl-D-alanine-endopeptidase